MLDGLEAAREILVDSHVAYVLEMGSELNEPIHGQYMDEMEESIEEVRNITLQVVKDGQDKFIDYYKLEMDV